MKKIFLITFLSLAFSMVFAQHIIVGSDSISVSEFEKEYQNGLQKQGIDTTINSYINFKVVQDYMKSMKVDTMRPFKINVSNYLNDLKKSNYYPKDLEDKYLNEYLSDNKKEMQLQVFMVKKDKETNGKVNFQDIYNRVRRGNLTMDQAILNEKGDPIAFYIKPGAMDWDLDKEVQKMPVGGYSKLIDNPEYVTFVKKVGERPSMGYVIFGTVSYANDDKAQSIKDSIYSALKAGTSFFEVTKKFGSNENEKNNGGVVMGSPTLPDAVYNELKSLEVGKYVEKPILVNDRWFVFYLVEKRPYAVTNEESRNFFFQDMMNSQYGNKFYEELMERMKKSGFYKETPLAAKIKASYSAFKSVPNDNDIIFYYKDSKVTIADIKDVIKDHLAEVEKMDNAKWAQLINMVNGNFLMQCYNRDFEQRPDVKQKVDEVKRNLYSEYFYTQYISKQIDDHPEWIADYFKANKDKYPKEAASKGRVIIPTNESDVPKFVKAIKNPGKWESLKAEYKDKVNDKKELLATFNSGEMVESAEVFTKYNVPFKKGVYTTKIGGRTLVMANDEILPAGMMTQEEAIQYGGLKEDVISNYINKVIKEQREKTKIVIEPGFISTLENKFKK